MNDIFTPIIPEDKWHHNFKALLRPEYKHVRATLRNWSCSFQDRDGKFVKEFQSSFNSSFWELYLYTCFRSLHFDIDLTHQRPDFLLSKHGSEFVAEAVIASNPIHGLKEHDIAQPQELTRDTIHKIIHNSTLRIANAISSKHKKYVSEYMHLQHVKGKPYIICISPFEQPFFYIQADNAIRRVLYGYGNLLYIKDRQGEVRIIGEERFSKVRKGDTSIDIGFFTNNTMPEVSAIIFSNTATITKTKALNSDMHPETFFLSTRYNKQSWDKPYFLSGLGAQYQESLLDGLHIFLNPYANSPIDPDMFYSRDIVVHDYDTINDEPLTFSDDMTLISHGCITFTSSDPATQIKSSKEIIAYPQQTFLNFSWDDDTLYPVEATVYLGVDNHMATYKGYTIVVFRDKIDNDWGAIAKKCTRYSIHDFISFNDDSATMNHEFFDSKDDAFIQIKRNIDTATSS